MPPDLIILREPSPEPVPTPPDSWAEGRARGAAARKPETLEAEPEIVSLETLEPAGGTSHVAFHKKYIDQPPARRTVRRRLSLSRGDARRGIVLAEILGPPKSER